MPAEVKYRGPSPEERLGNRLNDSGYAGDVNTQHGEGPTRVIHHVHHTGSNHGTVRRHDDKEEQGQ